MWQNRFFSCPLSADRLRRALAYVEPDPARPRTSEAERGELIDAETARRQIQTTKEKLARGAFLRSMSRYVLRPRAVKDVFGVRRETV